MHTLTQFFVSSDTLQLRALKLSVWHGLLGVVSQSCAGCFPWFVSRRCKGPLLSFLTQAHGISWAEHMMHVDISADPGTAGENAKTKRKDRAESCGTTDRSNNSNSNSNSNNNTALLCCSNAHVFLLLHNLHFFWFCFLAVQRVQNRRYTFFASIFVRFPFAWSAAAAAAAASRRSRRNLREAAATGAKIKQQQQEQEKLKCVQPKMKQAFPHSWEGQGSCPMPLQAKHWRIRTLEKGN